MTGPSVPKQPLVDALLAEWAAIDELLAGLPAGAWSTATTLPGWTVQDVVSHIYGTEMMLLGEQPPPSDIDLDGLAYVHNDMARFNETWVAPLRAESPEQVLARFREVVKRRRDALTAMSDEEWEAPAATPSGPGTYGRFMQIRLFDCWMHEQDIRETLGIPGHDSGPCAEVSLDEIVRGLGYIVGKRAGAPAGSTVTFELTGPIRRTLHVAVEGRAAVVPSLPAPATVRLSLTSNLFMRLAGGRVDPQTKLAEVTLDGDRTLGERIARNMAFTI